MPRNPGRILFVLTLALSLLACDYDAPISAKPMRRIDERLLGSWMSSDQKERMTVRKFDDFHYAVASDGGDTIFRAYHSDVSGIPLLTIQDINSRERKYFFARWRVDAAGGLSLEGISDDVIPTSTRTSAGIVKLLRKNATNPALFLPATTHTRMPATTR